METRGSSFCTAQWARARVTRAASSLISSRRLAVGESVLVTQRTGGPYAGSGFGTGPAGLLPRCPFPALPT